MVANILPFALGGLLGGGTQQTTTVSVASANTNTFNPNLVIGGASEFTPANTVESVLTPQATSTALQTQPDTSQILPLLTGLPPQPTVSGALGALPFTPTATPAPVGADNTLLIGGGVLAAAALFLFR